MAAFCGLNEIIKFLYDRGLNVNATTLNTNSTPLHFAIANQHTESESLLLELGADQNLRANVS